MYYLLAQFSFWLGNSQTHTEKERENINLMNESQMIILPQLEVNVAPQGRLRGKRIKSHLMNSV